MIGLANCINYAKSIMLNTVFCVMADQCAIGFFRFLCGALLNKSSHRSNFSMHYPA